MGQTDDTRPEHPWRTWRKASEYSYEKLAALVSTLLGRTVGHRYLEAIETGWRRPSYELAEAIERLSNHACLIEQAMKWPLRPNASRAARGAA